MIKKIFNFFLIITIFMATPTQIFAQTEDKKENTHLDVQAKSAILIEQSTGKVLYEQSPDEKLSPASVTKVMTLFLIYEAIEKGKIKWDDTVTVSEYASSMGGSQIFLEPMEKQSVKELTKSIAIASANDSAIAMAEFICGSEAEFVKLMNAKAKELGMKNTNFENACGLDTDTTNHYMSARDIAIISRELMNRFPEIQEFTTKWQDTIMHKTKKGEAEFGLTNTNKLIKWYDGATGLKTGSTSKALYCLSGTATRDELSLIAVVMGSPEPKLRFKEVMKMFDYGFSNYQIVQCDKKGAVVGKTAVQKGEKDFVDGALEDDVSFVIKKGNSTKVDTKIEMIEGIQAPVKLGMKIGEAVYIYNGNEIGRANIVTKDEIKKAGLHDIFKKLIIDWFS